MTIAKTGDDALQKKSLPYWMIPLFLLIFSPVLLVAQTLVTVRGRVMNAQNAPVSGVSVTENDSRRGVTTDTSGYFSISVPSRATLVISSVGYVTQEVRARSGQIDIVLQQGNKDLDQVVVIGYGTQKRSDVTGSVANISGAALNQVPGSDITRSLQGRIAGVEMSQTSSKPGASMQIRIRGTRSLNATNDPLIVLDGIPFIGTINDISPAEIKSVDILKDASATAIYGSRGANGVILITTNKGFSGQKARLTYSGYTGLKKVWGEYPMMSGPEFAALRKANNATPGASIHLNTLDENDTTNTDWQKLLYRDGYVINQDLAVTGGSEKGNYSIGFNYFKDQAVIPLQYYERYSIRTSLEQRIGSLFRIGLTTNNYYVNNHDQNLGPGSTLGLSPLASPRNPDGSWKTSININTSGPVWAYTKHALDALGDQYIDLDRAITSNNSIFGEINIPGVQGLKYRVNLGLYVHQDDYGTYTGTGVFSGTPTTASSAGISNAKQIDYTVENLLTYDRTFGKHKLSLTGLYSVEQNTKWTSSASATHLPADAFQFYNLSQVLADQSGASTVGGGTYAQYGLLSYMGRIIYSFNDRYFLTAAFRSDASSVLAQGHQWHQYPAVSVGWNIKNERFLQGATWIDALKPRVGYGQTSNQAINPYQTLGALTTSPYNFGPSGYAMGYYVTQLPNPALGWEFSKTWNYGADFTLFNGRLSGTAEYYSVNTSNVLLSVGLPTTSGVSSYTANIGATQNKGFELSLNGTVLDNHNGLTVQLGVNVYRNINKLVSLYSGQPYDKGNLWFPGHPIDVIYDYKKAGLMTYADSASGYMQAAYPGGNVGMIKVAYNPNDTSLHYDAHGVPNRKIGAGSALNNDDRQIYDMQPNFEGGFNIFVAYKNFDLNTTAYFKSGGWMESTLYGSAGYLNNLNTRAGNNVKESYWTPTIPNAAAFNTFAPRPGGVGGDNPAFGSTLGYFKASYMKIRTISLGYNFGQQWLKKASIERLRVYCTVENPFVLFSPYTKMSHMDPETNSYADQNTAVSAGPHRILTVGTNTPSTRNYVFGLNVTF